MIQTLTRWVLILVPHFRTVYFLHGIDRASGEGATFYLPDPRRIPEELQPCIHCVSTLVVLGKPLFPRYFPYRP